MTTVLLPHVRVREILKVRPPVYTTISHHIRGEVRLLLTFISSEAVNAGAVPARDRAFTKLLIFPACILWTSEQSNVRTTVIERTIRQRVKRWLRNDVTDLWLHAKTATLKQREAKQHNTTLATEKSKYARVTSYLYQDSPSRALRALLPGGVHDLIEQVKAKLLQKNPQHEPSSVPEGTQPPRSCPDGFPEAVGHLSFSAGEVYHAIGQTYRASAAGASGLSFNILFELLASDSLDEMPRLVRRLAQVCDLLARNTVPATSRFWLLSAPLIPLRKPDDGVRPIVVSKVHYSIFFGSFTDARKRCISDCRFWETITDAGVT